MNKKEIRDLIGSGRLNEAIKGLSDLLPSYQHNDIILLQSRLNGLERQERLGTIDNSSAGVERAKILSAVLSLLGNDHDSPGNSSSTALEHKGAASSVQSETANKNTAKSILFAAANPTNQASLQTDREHRTIREEMQKGEHRSAFQFLPIQTAVRITELMRAFNSKPNIVHFSGHGEEEGIVISNDQNEALVLGEATLKRLFRPLIGNTELVLLNSCYSVHQAEMISKMGMIVIGHNLPVGDDAAISFAKGFYLGLSEGMSYEEAYNAGLTTILAENAEYAEDVTAWKDGVKMDW